VRTRFLPAIAANLFEPEVKEGEGLEVASGYPPEEQLDNVDIMAARWTWEHSHPAGRGADTLPGGKRLFLPLRTPGI
jgi:two-component system sensor histidine kinase KdpD